ncbi:LytTR family DNA-binding domain-containing protein [Desulfitobacterium sp. PCE1]|uniref:LytR/AlgR family response regulator transcription factor n=1 Tax=Desulfitobacterium sp. PCE1 TaxID=146907 RepID=UPI000370080F|nr:LytTR family DNA-binding domain-containing protein [Desulfitobacterium sp. PCE1]
MIIGIVEDERLFQEELVRYLHEFMDINEIVVFDSGEDLLTRIDSLNLDILFLDIGLPGISGIKVAEQVRRDFPFLDIIFITADGSHIKEAFQLYASDYIDKPLNIDRLRSTLLRIKRRINDSGKKIEIKTEEGIILLNQNEIYWVEALSKKSQIHMKSNSHTCLHSLKEVEGQLDKKFFCRTSRSDLVNLRFIESIQPSTRDMFRIFFKDKDYQAYLQKGRYQELRKRIKDLNS